MTGHFVCLSWGFVSALLRLRLRNAPTELSLLLYQLSPGRGFTIHMRYNGSAAGPSEGGMSV